MLDFYAYSVVLIDLDAGEGEEMHLTNSPESYTVGTVVYYPDPDMELSDHELTGDMSKGEYTIKNLRNSHPLVQGLAMNLPYSSVAVTIRERLFDEDGTLLTEEYMFRGFVYQVEVLRGQQRVDLILRDNKYYLDTTAGIPCTEYCAAPYFGDLLICQKEVVFETNTVYSISGNVLTVSNLLVNTTPFLYNNGYIQYGAQRIKIKYHETGTAFQMARPVPSSWSGASITIHAGCDRRLETCRTIHNNEERFLALGIAMVDYNPMYEST